MTRQFQAFGWLLVLAGCGGVEPALGPAMDGMQPPATSATHDGAAGMGMGMAGGPMPSAMLVAAGAPAAATPEAPKQADPQPPVPEPQAGTGGAAGPGASAGAGGGGSTFGTGGVGGAGGQAAAGAGGSAGGAGSGAAGSAGSPAIDCPLGTLDADGNGYPDACEKTLWSVGYQVTDFTQVNVYYTPAVPVFLFLAAGGDGSAECPSGQSDLGYSNPVLSLAPQNKPDAQIFDAVSDPTARVLAACLSANNAATAGVFAWLAPAGSTHPANWGPLPSAPTVLPHLLGKHILYFARFVSAYDIAPPYMGEKGTRVLQFSGGFSAVGY